MPTVSLPTTVIITLFMSMQVLEKRGKDRKLYLFDWHLTQKFSVSFHSSFFNWHKKTPQTITITYVTIRNHDRKHFPPPQGRAKKRVTANQGRGSCQGWTRRESNPRPNGERRCFLHAYLFLTVSDRKEKSKLFYRLSSKNFIKDARPSPTISDLLHHTIR